MARTPASGIQHTGVLDGIGCRPRGFGHCEPDDDRAAVLENRDWLGDARECHSLTKIYLPLKGQIESLLETLGGSERADS